MARQKMLPEYFLNRIREFQKKNGRPPRSNEFNGPFSQNVKKHFGSWQNAVNAALGIKLSHGHMTDAEMLQEIKNFVAANNRIPNRSELKHDKLIAVRFGSYALAIEASEGFNPETEILLTLRWLTALAPFASLYEIAQELTKLKITRAQVRGFLGHLVHYEMIEVHKGDRIALYRLTSKGKETLKEREHKMVENYRVG